MLLWFHLTDNDIRYRRVELFAGIALDDETAQLDKAVCLLCWTHARFHYYTHGIFSSCIYMTIWILILPLNIIYYTSHQRQKLELFLVIADTAVI